MALRTLQPVWLLLYLEGMSGMAVLGWAAVGTVVGTVLGLPLTVHIQWGSAALGAVAGAWVVRSNIRRYCNV